MDLWTKLPSGYDKMPTIEYYKAEKKLSDCAFIIFPGGGYTHYGEQEASGYAKLINTWGIDAFVVRYSLSPMKFPHQLNDARRAVQLVRNKATEYQINPDKIVVIGSSAGGHLAAMLSTFTDKTEVEISDEISKEQFLPNLQVLCYPVIDFTTSEIAHTGSRKVLLDEDFDSKLAEKLSPHLACNEKTPPAFIWHNADDNIVNVNNSVNYAKDLISYKVPVELHIFPYGSHGVGAAANKHCGQWTNLLFKWLKEMKFY